MRNFNIYIYILYNCPLVKEALEIISDFAFWNYPQGLLRPGLLAQADFYRISLNIYLSNNIE